MRRLLTLLIFSCLIFLPQASEAQSGVQRVVVQTNRRLNVDGTLSSNLPIADVTLTIIGTPNMISTAKDGSATFGVQAEGSYQISRVHKDNYVLADIGYVLGQVHHHSKEPLRIYMDDTKELDRYRYAVSVIVRKSVQGEIAKLQSRLDSLQACNSANEAELQRLRAEVSTAWRDSEDIIADATERYLSVDFNDPLDEDVKFYTSLLAGDLTAAKAMLRSREEIEAGARKVKIGQVAFDKHRDSVAKECMRMCDMYALELQRDSVAYFLELRASLDRTNVEWQVEAASYIENLLGDYNRANDIYDSTLAYCREHYGEFHEKTAYLYNATGIVYHKKRQVSDALKYYRSALNILERVPSTNIDIASVYGNIGAVYSDNRQYEEALMYFEKAITSKQTTTTSADDATTYNNIGTLYYRTGDYAKALEYYDKSLQMRLALAYVKPSDLALCYNNIAAVYVKRGMYDEALKNYRLALSLRESYLHPMHEIIALTYADMGMVYDFMGSYKLAVENLTKALNIFEYIYPADHRIIAAMRSTISKINEKIK